MRIGIVGTRDMGRALGVRWVHGGHQVLFGSRDHSKAEAAAARAGPGAQFGDGGGAGPRVVVSASSGIGLTTAAAAGSAGPRSSS